MELKYCGKELGWSVISKGEIRKNTIICEYGGNVYFQKQILFDQNDDMMDLLIANSANESLVISPTTHANLARFINGTNNYSDQNVND